MNTINSTANTTANTTTTLINNAISNLSTIQDNLNKMFCLQRNIANFMDEVMKMNPIKDTDSLMIVQLEREDAACYTDIVLDYLSSVTSMIDDIDKNLNKAFEIAKNGGEHHE